MLLGQDAAEPNRKPVKPPRLTGTAVNRAENRTGGTGPGNGTEPEKPDRVVRAEPTDPSWGYLGPADHGKPWGSRLYSRWV